MADPGPEGEPFLGELVFLRALQEDSSEPAFLIGADRRILYLNAAAEALMARPRSETLGRDFNGFSPAEFRERRARDHERVMAGETLRYRTMMHPPGLPRRHIEVHTRPVDWNGRRYSWSTIRDVTDAVQAEAALQESEQRHRSLVEALEEGIILVASDGAITACNPSAARILGLTREELTGRTTVDSRWESVHEDGTPWSHEEYPVNVARRTGVAQAGKVLGVRRPDGGTTWILLTAVPLQRPDESSPYEVLVSFSDITERREAERRRAIQFGVTTALAQAGAEAEVIPRVLRAVGEALGWIAGVYWRGDAAARELRCGESWEASEAGVGEFLEASRGRIFLRGVGLPGRVLASRSPAWVPDVMADGDFPRVPVAARCGLHAAAAFPVVVGGAIVGVVEFFSREIRPPDRDLLQTLAAVGQQVGLFVQRCRAEETLRRREDLFRSMIENSSDSIAVMNREGVIVYQNPAVTRQLGYSVEEFVGTNALSLVHPEDLGRVVEALTRGLGNPGTVESVEFRFRAKDGSWRTMESVGQGVRGEAGEPVAVVNSRDITERRRAEEALRESEERWRSLVESSPDFILTVDRDYRIRFLNRLQPGFRMEDVVGRRVFEFLPADWVGVQKEALDRVFAGSDSVTFETAGMGPHGSPAWYASRVGPIRKDGRVVAATVVSTDITGRRRAEEELRRITEEQALILANTRDFLYRHDVHGVFTYLSPSVEQVTGWAPEEWKAHYTKFMTDHPMNRQVIALTEETLRTGKQCPPYLVEIRRKDGAAIMLEVNERAYREEGRIAGIVGVARDVTERERARVALQEAVKETRRAYAELKRAQARLIRSEKLAAVGMLVSGVAHEINNPINVVYGNLRLLKEHAAAMRGARKAGASAEARRASKAVPGMLADALKAAESAREAIQEFRNFARDPGTAESVDLVRAVEEALGTLKRTLKGVRVRRDLTAVPPVRGDSGQLRRVLLNLVRNAVEAMDGGGELTVRTWSRGRRAFVSVADTGRGFSAKVRRRMFEPFFTTKPEGRGMGLGLAIAETIVHNHGGRIRVSTREGRGSVFTIELPIRR